MTQPIRARPRRHPAAGYRPVYSFNAASPHLAMKASRRHRKRQQAAYPDLTLTGMYNVLDKLRSGAALSAKRSA
jgi:hypothetical protein